MIYNSMLRYLEKTENKKYDDLYKGLCSKALFYRLLNTEKEMNAVLFFYMLQRLPVSPKRFRILIDQKEYEYFMWLSECRNSIIRKDFRELKKLIEKAEGNKEFQKFGEAVIHQIEYFRYITIKELEGDESAVFELLRRSIDYLLGPDDELLPGRYSADEFNRYMNFIMQSLTIGKITPEQAKDRLDRMITIMKSEARDPRETSYLYPRAVCTILHGTESLFSHVQKKSMIIEAMDAVNSMWSSHDLFELLNLMITTCEENNDPEIEIFRCWREALETAFDLGDIPNTFDPYNNGDISYCFYMMHEYLKYNRLYRKRNKKRPFSLEEVSDDIMQVRNYIHNEAGDYNLKKDHFKKLAERMKLNSELYQGIIVTRYAEDFTLVTDIRKASNIGDKQRLQIAMEKLEEHLDSVYPENRQFLDQAYLDLKILNKEIAEEESIEELISILEITYPYEPDEDRSYTEQEIEIIYRIVRLKRKYGRLEEKDIEVIKACLKSEDRAPISSWSRCGALKRLLAGIYQTENRPEEGAELSLQCIHEMLMAQDISMLEDCLDIYAESIAASGHEKAKQVLKAAYWICDLHKSEGNKRAINNLYIQLFSTSILSEGKSG